MQTRIYTGFKEQTLKISVNTLVAQNVSVIVVDPAKDNTVLFDTADTIQGEDFFIVPLPLCGEFSDIYIDTDGEASTFEYLGCEILPLQKRPELLGVLNVHLNEFVNFIQKFSYNAGWMRTNDPSNENDYYTNNNNPISPNYRQFLIKYLPEIVDESGNKIPTPCRIDIDNGMIEASQEYFVDYTVPMRMAVLLHEYSHTFINENPDDESEADLNGLIIYLGLGFPRNEAFMAWCQVFDDSGNNSEQMQRINVIDQFIVDYDNNNVNF